MSGAGTFIGIGVGPGDPELLTLKAARLIGEADLVVYPATFENESTARAIAVNCLREAQSELAIRLPMQSGERGETEAIYRRAADEISVALDAGSTVVFLCLGDPLLYGSFIYLYELLADAHACEVVPGVSSVSAASAISLTPLTRLNQNLLVVPAFRNDEELRHALGRHDSLVIMKVGRHRHRVVELIDAAGRHDDAVYIEHATMAGEQVIEDIARIPEGPGSYFSLFLVTRVPE